MLLRIPIRLENSYLFAIQILADFLHRPHISFDAHVADHVCMGQKELGWLQIDAPICLM